MPYQKISREEYLKRKMDIKPINWGKILLIDHTNEDMTKNAFCTNDKCIE